MILYKKAGRKYVPVQEHVDTTGWSKGHYLVIVHPGLVSMTRIKLNPDYPAALAALHDAREAMIKAIVDASRPKPDRKLNPRQQDAMDLFIKECDGMTFTRDSAVEIVTKAMEVLE